MELIERYTVSKDWMTLTLVAAFLFVFLAKLAFPDRFENFTKLIYSNRYFRLRQKAFTWIDSFTTLLCSVNILSVSLVIYIFLNSFSFLGTVGPKIAFIQIMLAYSLFFITKFFLEKITADVFHIENIIDPYLFYKLTYQNFIALLLLPVNILLIYAFRPSHTIIILIFCVLALISIAVLGGFYRRKRKVLLPHSFYFILYLCTFEIAPYFILYKVFIYHIRV